jgi:hypothetical protein
VLHSGLPRSEPHVDRKLSAIDGHPKEMNFRRHVHSTVPAALRIQSFAVSRLMLNIFTCAVIQILVPVPTENAIRRKGL